MTEVPEHLLKRSQDRRAALGLGGDGGDAAPAADSGASASTAVESAASAAPAAAAAAPIEKAPPEPEYVPPYVEASEQRKRIPVWAMPVLAFLPVWAVIYAQSLSAPPTTEKTQLATGADTYATFCAACHLASGAGSTGRQLSDGQVLKTFPNIAGQLQYVRLGDVGMGDGPYGNPARDGGQHQGPYNGAKMPAWSALTDAQLLDVVRHERETLSGEKPAKVDAAGNLLWANGKPMLDASGKLVWDDGTPMFDKSGQPTKPIDQTQKTGAS